MKTKEYLAVVVVLVAGVLLVFSAIPNMDVVGHLLLEKVAFAIKWLWGMTLMVVLLLVPVIFGPLVSRKILPALDEHFTPERKLTRWQKFFLAVLLSLILGMAWLIVVPLVSSNPIVNENFKSFVEDWTGQYWSGHYEVAPLGWGAYAAGASLVFYLIWTLF